LERGWINEDEDEEEEETGDFIFVVCCNGIELALNKMRIERVGNNGIEVRFGQSTMLKEERHGKQSIINSSFIVASSLLFSHHPFRLGQL
jgi:hypothetical protein